MRIFLFRFFPRRTSFVWLEAGEIERFREAWSSRFCPNTSFAYVCTNCSFRDNTGCICLSHNCTRHMVYEWMYSCLYYPLDVLVSCDWYLSICSLVTPSYSISAGYISFFITLIMLHLTFNLSRSIASLCAHNPSSPHPASVCTLDSFSLLDSKHKRRTAGSSRAFVPLVVFLYWASNTNTSMRAISVVGHAIQSFYSTWIPPFQSSKFTAALMGQILTQKRTWIQLYCWHFHSSEP